MSQEIRNDLAGSAVFWSIGDGTDFDKLDRVLRTRGFGKFVPEKMTNYAALRAALEEEYPDCECFPIKGVKDTIEVVRVRRDMASSNQNDYQHVVTAVVKNLIVSTDLNDYTTTIRLQIKFDEQRCQVNHNAVSRALVGILFDLGGTALRPSGGVYWCPVTAWERWEALANDIETCGLKNKIFALRTILDEHSAGAIREALTMEIAREARLIQEKLDDLTTGKVAASTCRKAAKDLRNKIVAYEDAFAILLPDLKETLDVATGQEAIATIAESAGLMAFCQ